MMNERVGLLTQAAAPTTAESALAARLGLPLVLPAELQPGKPEFYLCIDVDGLSLHSQEQNRMRGVTVNFDNHTLDRRAKDALRQQNLIKAIGLKKHVIPRVLDCTAGLGSDAFLLARAGCEVILLERNAIVHALLEDGMQRAVHGSPETCEAVSRMRLLFADFADYAANLGSFDVVYLDPMYPLRHKSAKSKKSMYLLQRLLDEADEDEEVLTLALQKANSRVVIKRAKQTPHYGNRQPDLSFKGSSSRFDVYLVS